MAPDRAGRAGRPTPAMLRLLDRVIRPVVSLLFRPKLEGVANLPDDGPYLLVSNHNAGMGAAELASFASAYVEEVGAARPLAGFAHPIGFRVWPFSRFIVAVGAVPSTYEAAAETLAEGVPLLVFPGGDHETLRPIWQANLVDFGGRQGFLRIARRAKVPIVPMGIQGSHITAPIVWRSKVLPWLLVFPRLMGIKRWGLSVLGVAGCALILSSSWSLPMRVFACWLWLGSPLVFLPILPSRIRFRIGSPIPPPVDEEDETLDAAYARVVGTIQGLVRDQRTVSPSAGNTRPTFRSK